MKKAIVGKKLGMTQVFAADGTMLPVTVVIASFIALPTMGIKLPTANFTPFSASVSAPFAMIL